MSSFAISLTSSNGNAFDLLNLIYLFAYLVCELFIIFFYNLKVRA